MFEDSLMESTGKIRTRSKGFAIVSFAAQGALLTGVVLFPLIHPAALPRFHSTAHLWLLELPRRAPRVVQTQAATTSRNSNVPRDLEKTFRAPGSIPKGIPKSEDSAPAWAANDDPLAGSG